MKKTGKNVKTGGKRPGWDSYFMEIARVVAKRGNCIRRKVAAVIVKHNRIVATGYNGTPKGIANCCDGGCARCAGNAPSGEDLGQCACSHAEENAIVQCAYYGVATNNAVIYSTCSPCLACARLIIGAGIAEVVYEQDYKFGGETTRLFREAGVKYRKYKGQS